MKNIVLNKKWSFFIWILLWIPLSFTFPVNTHFPLGGALSPLSAFFTPFMGSSGHSTFSFDWKYVYFPALVFWLGGFFFVIFTQYLMRTLRK